MKNWRNLLMLIAFLGFCLWYGGTWAYRTQFAEPRKKLLEEIKTLEEQKANIETGIATQKDMVQKLAERKLYERSLPIPANRAQMLYQSWLIELGEHCGFENFSVDSQNLQQTQFYFVLPYRVTARTTLDELSRFLYEFYWATYVHRITHLRITPVENADMVTVTMQIEGIVVPSPEQNSPYPLRDRLPSGYHRRLTSGLLETYTGPINARNLMQFTRGGADASDFAKLTGIIYVGGEPEFWINSQLENTVVRVKLNEQFRIGSFIGRIVEIIDGDVILETGNSLNRNPMRWVLGTGELLKDALAVPDEY